MSEIRRARQKRLGFFSLGGGDRLWTVADIRAGGVDRGRGGIFYFKFAREILMKYKHRIFVYVCDFDKGEPVLAVADKLENVPIDCLDDKVALYELKETSLVKIERKHSFKGATNGISKNL